MGMYSYPEFGEVSEINKYIFNHQMKYGTMNRTDDEIELEEFIDKVLRKFGDITPDGKWFITSYNEHYSDSGYNPAFQLLEFLNKCYGIDADSNYKESFDLPLSSVLSGANANEIAEELDVELAEFDEDW